MKLLSFQPFSLSSNSGGSRILRRLYSNFESNITSLVVTPYSNLPALNGISEITIHALPTHRIWMRWHFRKIFNWLREGACKNYTARKIKKAAKKIPHDIVHVLNHYSFSAVLCSDSFFSNKIFWVSFHDHFLTTGSSFRDTNILWHKAERRFVISVQLGEEYQRLFGNKTFEVITDGVSEDEISIPGSLQFSQSPVIVYFAGLLHLEYLPLFQVLGDALDILSREGFKFQVVLRGTPEVKCLDKRGFKVEYRPTSLDNNKLKEELDKACILYLPIKFTNPEFYLYSLSTKMVGYLGAPGSILYHGPQDSAVAHLLREFNACISCHSLDVDNLIESLRMILEGRHQVSSNAKSLVRERFNLTSIQNRFWQNNFSCFKEK